MAAGCRRNFLRPQLHGNLTPAHADGCAAQCFEGVQRGSLIILSACPRQQAATPVLRPGVSRSPVMGSPKSRRLFGERRSSATSELSRLRGSEGCVACFDEIVANRPTGSTQTDRIRLPYTALGLSFSKSEKTPCGKGEHIAPGPGSAQVKPQDRYDQLRFQPPAQIFVYLIMRKSIRIIACPHRQRGYVAGIMSDHPVHRIGITHDSGSDHRVREQCRLRIHRFSHPLHLPSAPSAADRLSVCGC